MISQRLFEVIHLVAIFTYVCHLEFGSIKFEINII